MNEDSIRQTVLQALGTIVPEADLASIDPRLEFREQLDMDSMDFLNFVIAMDQQLGVEVPEIDYPKLSTLDDCVAYMSARLVTAWQPLGSLAARQRPGRATSIASADLVHRSTMGRSG